MKKLVALFVSIVLLASMVGFAMAEGEPFDAYPRPKVSADGKLTVAYIYGMPTVESAARMYYQVKEEFAHRGWTFVEMLYNGDEEFRNCWNNCINQGVDAIITGTLNGIESKQDLFDMARNAGIGVYSIDSAIAPGIIINSTMSNGTAAMQMMYAIGAEHNWTDNIAILVMNAAQSQVERAYPVNALLEYYNNVEVLDLKDVTTDGGGYDICAYNIANTWFQKYGSELTGVFAACDYIGMPAAEAAASSMELNEKFWVAGFDGGSTCWYYMRQPGTYFKYSYAQPFELYTHQVFECVDQIQGKGMTPGDPGCIISYSGQTLYSDGIVINSGNVPDVGTNIHEVFNYYGLDPADANAWYNWKDGSGAYTVGSGEN